MPLLEINQVSRMFGGLKALDRVRLHVEAGELIGLIGPNGAGKTTLFNLITGVYEPSEGTIFFDHRRLNGLKPFEIAQRGIARTFQNIRLFKELSVFDNVRLAGHTHVGYGILAALLQSPRWRKQEQLLAEETFRLLKLFGLEEKREAIARNLPYGDQRRIEIARALAVHPRLLLLDEPTAGMNPQETEEMMHLIRWIREEFDLTILLIEHDMRVVMGICERILVLDYGVPIAEGTAEEIQRNPDVIKAYLGEG